MALSFSQAYDIESAALFKMQKGELTMRVYAQFPKRGHFCIKFNVASTVQLAQAG